MYGGARKDATNIWILNNQFKFRMLEKEEKQVREECSRPQQAAAAEANSPSKIEGEFPRSGTAVPKMAIKAYESPDISVLQH